MVCGKRQKGSLLFVGGDENAEAAVGGMNNADPNGDLGGVPFADDIALAHIVGIDGSYAFLEYAFWFSVLCGGFVTVFYLLPYTSGRLVVHDLCPLIVMLGVKVRDGLLL